QSGKTFSGSGFPCGETTTSASAKSLSGDGSLNWWLRSRFAGFSTFHSAGAAMDRGPKSTFVPFGSSTKPPTNITTRLIMGRLPPGSARRAEQTPEPCWFNVNVLDGGGRGSPEQEQH